MAFAVACMGGVHTDAELADVGGGMKVAVPHGSAGDHRPVESAEHVLGHLRVLRQAEAQAHAGGSVDGKHQRGGGGP
eukprot:CAMPEP_0195607682 /NCGR_PEP_ID=MMETSP0815-20121206/8345_1 /TAXON_ID=97485 /ORGANISM="Prymnesium parvum, Strain Texoma1" /LENGTH=76 /DNA_ID=CAMNT_0040747499 /DNA_START=443 /DNA_END=671 /DNA_ORIENTATION=+